MFFCEKKLITVFRTILLSITSEIIDNGIRNFKMRLRFWNFNCLIF